MELRYAPWGGTGFLVACELHIYLMGIGVANLLSGLLTICTLGTLSASHNWWGLARKGTKILEDVTGERCDCDDCMDARGERLSRDEIDAAMQEFQDRGAGIEEVQAFFKEHGIQVDVMPMPPMEYQPSKKDEETFH